MNKKEEVKLQEIETAAKSGQLSNYIAKLRPEETSYCLAVINKWQEESLARHEKAWHKAVNKLQKQAVEKTEMREMQIIAHLLFQFLKKKFLEGIERKQRIRQQN